MIVVRRRFFLCFNKMAPRLVEHATSKKLVKVCRKLLLQRSYSFRQLSRGNEGGGRLSSFVDVT